MFFYSVLSFGVILMLLGHLVSFDLLGENFGNPRAKHNLHLRLKNLLQTMVFTDRKLQGVNLVGSGRFTCLLWGVHGSSGDVLEPSMF